MGANLRVGSEGSHVLTMRCLDQPRSINRIMARRRQATANRARLFLFLDHRRFRPIRPTVRSTIHRFGSTTKRCRSVRLTISICHGPSALTAAAVGAPCQPPSAKMRSTKDDSLRTACNTNKSPSRSCTSAGREILGQRPPLALGAEQLEDRVDQFAHVGRPQTPTAPGRTDVRRRQCPFRVRQIGRIAQPAPLIPSTVLNGPQAALRESDVAE